MNSKILLSTALASTAVLTGCLQHETTIHLKSNGSGTIVEETRFGAQAMAMLSQMPTEGKEPFAEMFSEQKAKTRSTKLGEGVTFEKIEKIDLNGTKGARIIYRFTDINKVQLTPGSGMSDMSPAPGPDSKTSNEHPIRFSLSGDDLTIEMPRPEKQEKSASPKPRNPANDNPQAEAMAKQMMGDMKVSVKIVAVDGIDDSNATYREGGTITLMAMDMGKILNQPGAFKKLQNAGNGDPAAAMEAMKGIDGMKFEPKEKITIDLK